MGDNSEEELRKELEASKRRLYEEQEDSRTGLHKLVLWLYHNKWKVLFWVIATVFVVWGVIEVFNWWFDRTIGSSDDWSGIWVFGLGVFAVFYIWNLFD